MTLATEESLDVVQSECDSNIRAVPIFLAMVFGANFSVRDLGGAEFELHMDAVGFVEPRAIRYYPSGITASVSAVSQTRSGW